MKSIIFIFCLAATLVSCEQVRYPKTEYLGEVLDCISAELSDIHGLYFAGQELSGKEGVFKYIDFQLDLRGHSLDKDQVRPILVRIQKTLLDCVNNHPDTEKFFGCSPVGMEQVRITLFLSEVDGISFLHPYVTVGSSRCGTVRYYSRTSREIGPYDVREAESWEEAVRIVEGDSGSNAD